MADDLYQQALKEAFASNPSNDRVLDTVELYAEGITSLFYVKDKTSKRITLETEETVVCRPAEFDAPLPTEDEQGNNKSTVTCARDDGVLNFITQAHAAGVRTYVRRRFYLASDLSAPQNPLPLEYLVDTATIQSKAIQAKCFFAEDTNNKTFPRNKYKRAVYPSLGNT